MEAVELDEITGWPASRVLGQTQFEANELRRRLLNCGYLAFRSNEANDAGRFKEIASISDTQEAIDFVLRRKCGLALCHPSRVCLLQQA